MQPEITTNSYNQTFSNELFKESNGPRPELELLNDQYKFILCLLIAYPFGYLNHFIHGYYKRLLYSIIIGLSLQFYFFKKEMIQTLICFIANFIIIKIEPQKSRVLLHYIFLFAFIVFKLKNFNMRLWHVENGYNDYLYDESLQTFGFRI